MYQLVTVTYLKAEKEEHLYIYMKVLKKMPWKKRC